LPEYEGGNWIGFAVPAGTPKAIVERLHKEIAAIQDLPEVKNEFLKRGSDVVKMGPAELQAYYEKQIATWGNVVKTAGIKAE
jgi:tripartite-type tricarboxylate transporter receptor subunit TctC